MLIADFSEETVHFISPVLIAYRGSTMAVGKCVAVVGSFL